MDAASTDTAVADVANVDATGLLPDTPTADASPDVPPSPELPETLGGGPTDDFILETRRLGMNDVSFLFQLPAHPNVPTFARMTGFIVDGDLIPRSAYSQITGAGDIVNPYEEFQIVAMRVDLCDRTSVGPCDSAADGQLRLTFQPLVAGQVTRAADIALHVSYRIPLANLAWVINELRALSRLRDLDPSAPLQVNGFLQPGTEYANRLRILAGSFASADNVTRLTVFDQPAWAAPFLWIFSGLERVDGTLTYVPISGINIEWIDQTVVVNDETSFSPSPIADIPAGFTLSLWGAGFQDASTEEQRGALGALATTLNPTKTTIKTTQCAGCHLATFLFATRATSAAIDPSSVSNLFSSQRDLSIAGGASGEDNRSLRAFGWRESVPEISQRVVNETAMVLDEIENRFPVAP